MSFGESIFSAGFVWKTIKVVLHVRFNCAYPQQNRHQKVSEDSRGLHTKTEGERLPSGAAQPHLQATWPLGPTVSLHVAISVLHRLLGCIYTIL